MADQESGRKLLVLEHARLATQFAQASDPGVREEISSRLQQIEQSLNMTAREVAAEAIRIYKTDY